MAFPTTSVLDNTTRADESPLANGAVWANARIANADYKLQLASNAINSAGAGYGSQYISTSYGPDCEVYASFLSSVPFSSSAYLWLRVQNPDTGTYSGYRAQFDKNSQINLHSVASGVYTLIGNSTTGWTGGATPQIGMRAVGNVITCYVDGTEALNVIDNTYLGSGKIGATVFGTSGFSLTTFGGGTYSVASPASVEFDPHPNLVYGTIAAAPVPAASGTFIGLADATNFPDPATDGSYNVTIWPTGSRATLSNAEVVRVTAKSGSNLTVTRAQEGTSARSIIIGDQVAVTWTKKSMTDIEACVSPRFSRTVGKTSVADGGTITHGLGTTPDGVIATGSVSGEFVSVTTIGATTFTVAVKKHDNTAGTTQNVSWMAFKDL